MRIHIIGIAGVMTAPLAIALKKNGHQITGSDQNKIYPPISTILKKAKIAINTLEDYDSIDLVIVGSSHLAFSNTKQEFENIKKLKIPYISATEYISQNVIKNNSILLAGTFGKTTITSLVAWILENAKLNPSYMFGGQSLNKIPSLLINTRNWSVVEGDESINGLDTKAKFLYYPTKYVILTNASWEHKESYKDEQDNFQAFKKLVENIPKDGLLIINSQGCNTLSLSKFSKAKVIYYNGSNSQYMLLDSKISDNSELTIKTPKGVLKIYTQLLGEFNFENILAAISLSIELGIDIKIIQKALLSYKGISRRLEKIKTNFFDDFGQSSERIKSAIHAIKLHFPNQKIFVYLEPHATFLLTRQGLSGLKEAFFDCEKIILSKIPFSRKISISNRSTAVDYSNEIGDNLIYIPQNKDLYQYFCKTLKSNDILVHFSSGGAEGLKTFKKIINYHIKCRDM